MNKSTLHASFGELIALLYERYFELYDDEKLTTLAVTTTINELMQNDPYGARRLIRSSLAVGFEQIYA